MKFFSRKPKVEKTLAEYQSSVELAKQAERLRQIAKRARDNAIRDLEELVAINESFNLNKRKIKP